MTRALARSQPGVRPGRWPLRVGSARPSRLRALFSLVEIVDKHDDADRGNAGSEAEFGADADAEIRADEKYLHQNTNDNSGNTDDFTGHSRL